MTATETADRTAEFEDEVRRELSPDLEIVRRLGGGPLSTVYLAREPALQRLVAVKVLHLRATRRTKSMARFRREARALARVSHPNVVSIFRVGDLASEIPYLVMQYIRGPALAGRLLDKGRLEVEESCSVLGAVGGALAAVHAHGIVHRDVRPESILCEQPGGRVLLADFGLAAFLATTDEAADRITTAGHIVTDIQYSAPEFLVGEEPTSASDVYSLGVLAYHVLTGDGPHDAATATAQVQAHLREAPVRLGSRDVEAPAALQELLDACLAKAPADRPASGGLAEAFGKLTTEPGLPPADEISVAGKRLHSVAKRTAGRPGLVLRLLGGLDLDGSTETAATILRQPKRVALLAYLAAGPEAGYRRRDSLIGLFWPDSDSESARHSLRQALYVLRKGIGSSAIRTRGDEEVGLDPVAIESDAARFQALARDGFALEAMQIYRGDLLPGFYLDDTPEFEHWLEVERVRLRRLASDLSWTLAEAARRDGNDAEAARRARKAVELDPFNELGLHRLIELLDTQGDRAGALTTFDHFVSRLTEEYEAEPSPETLALVDRVRSRQ
ncbi:MAG: protein kinase [Gemmatimonadota bacterium]